MSDDLIPTAAEQRAKEVPSDVEQPNPYESPASLAPPTADAETQEVGPDDPEPEPSSREQDAARALKSAILGLLFCPLQIYTAWLLLLVLMDDEPLRPRYFWYAVGAAAVLAPYAAIVGVFGWLNYGS